MGKGENTKTRIIQRSAELMNLHGYVSTPISGIMKAAELRKGGLYNHFEGRDAIAAAAYEYAVDVALNAMIEIERSGGDALERVEKLMISYRNYGDKIPIKGGCPILRGAVESANGPDWLQQRARSAVQRMIGIFERLLSEAKGAGQLHSNVVPQRAATAIVAGLEGAVMVCGIQKSNAPAGPVLDMLEAYIYSCRSIKKDR